MKITYDRRYTPVDPQRQARAVATILTQGMALDAGPSFAAQIEHELVKVQAELIETEFGKIEALERWIQEDPDRSPPGAESVKIYIYTAEGVADVVSNYSDDIPLVNGHVDDFEFPFFTLAIGYTISLQDVWRAELSQVRINTQLPRDARRALARKTDEILLIGLPDANVPGLFNHPNISDVVLPNGSWDSPATTANEVLADLRFYEESIINATLRTHYPDTIIVPTDLMPALNQPLGSGSDTTVWDQFVRTSALSEVSGQSWIRGRNERLDTADNGSPRTLMYKRGADVVSADIPVEAEEQMPQMKNLMTIVHVVSRTAPAIVKRPLAAAYSGNAHS